MLLARIFLTLTRYQPLSEPCDAHQRATEQDENAR